MAPLTVMRARMPFAPLALAALACAGLTACGGPTCPRSRRHRDPEPLGEPSRGALPPARPPPRRRPPPKSEVKGRDFDFGLVTSAKKVGDTDVLVIDRWTDPNVHDEELADDGLEAAPWDLGSDRYVNQNDEVTFEIPVREGTSFLLHHCVAKGEPLQSRSVGAQRARRGPRGGPARARRDRRRGLGHRRRDLRRLLRAAPRGAGSPLSPSSAPGFFTLGGSCATFALARSTQSAASASPRATGAA